MAEEYLYEAACKNLKNAGEAFFVSMDTVLSQLMNPGADIGSVPMYILSNKWKINGAAQILNNDILKLASESMKGDFAMLPSSIHEWIFVPYSKKNSRMDDVQKLAGIVREVNNTQVAETEVLSYHVYHYSSKDGEVTIAA